MEYKLNEMEEITPSPLRKFGQELTFLNLATLSKSEKVHNISEKVQNMFYMPAHIHICVCIFFFSRSDSRQLETWHFPLFQVWHCAHSVHRRTEKLFNFCNPICNAAVAQVATCVLLGSLSANGNRPCHEI